MTPSLYIAYLTSPLTTNGTETEVFVNSLQTLTGETIDFSNFTPFTRGILIVDSEAQFGTQPEIISFTNINRTELSFTGAIRGLSALDSSTRVSGNMPYHGTGTPVIISWGAQNISDLISYINTLVSGTAGNASNTVFGLTSITENLGVRPRAMASLVSQQTSPVMTLKVNPFALSDQGFDVTYAGGNTGAMVAPVTNPRIDLIVYNANSAALAIRTGSEGVTPTKPTPTQYDIVLATVYHRVGETSIKETDDSSNGYISRWYYPSVYNANLLPAGSTLEANFRTAPAGYLPEDGSSVSRSTYAGLFTALCPSFTATISNASPAVISATAHGLVVGDRIHFTTTGSLPSGIATNTDYYVISAGFGANSFEIALTLSGAAINTTTAGSGVHTCYYTPFGKGDGSTTFTLPSHGGKHSIGVGATTMTLSFEAASVDTTNDWVTITNTIFPSQGQAVVLTTTGALPTGLSLATTYYIVRLTSTTIGFATSLAGANAGTLINITSIGSGVNTATFTGRTYTVLGTTGGEETHGVSIAEMPGHTHPMYIAQAGGSPNVTTNTVNAGGTSSSYVASTGGDLAHNNVSPFITKYFFVKI